MDCYLCLRVADAVREQIEAGILRPGDKLPARAELAALLLLRRSYSWSIGMDFRSRIWVASFAGNRIRRDTPLTLFDALALAAQARREIYVKDVR